VVALLDGRLERAFDEGGRAGEDRGAGRARTDGLPGDRAGPGLGRLEERERERLLPLPRMFSAKLLVSLMSGWACESTLTPTTTSGGSNATCVTQFTVAAATRPLLSAAVRT
jgi:hypothetical protein